jgi:hypothetical protein
VAVIVVTRTPVVERAADSEVAAVGSEASVSDASTTTAKPEAPINQTRLTTATILAAREPRSAAPTTAGE